MKNRICVICNKPFDAKFPSSPTKLCSLECKKELARQNAIKQFSSTESREKASIITSIAMKRDDVRNAFNEGMKNRRSYDGENHPLWGTHRSAETKRKIGEANKGRFKGMTWEEIIGEARAQERKIENHNYMLQTNEKLLNERTSKLEKLVAINLINVGFIQNQRISKYVVDFVNNSTKEILEVNGDYWHCNPELFDRHFFNFSIDMTSDEKWDCDFNRYKSLEKLGYDVAIVWENDIKKYGIKIISDRELLKLLQERKMIAKNINELNYWGASHNSTLVNENNEIKKSKKQNYINQLHVLESQISKKLSILY